MRFIQGRYVIFRDAYNGRRYFTGKFDTLGFPRETFIAECAKAFCSAAHGYKYGSERVSLQSWRVGRA